MRRERDGRREGGTDGWREGVVNPLHKVYQTEIIYSIFYIFLLCKPLL